MFSARVVGEDDRAGSSEAGVSRWCRWGEGLVAGRVLCANHLCPYSAFARDLGGG